MRTLITQILVSNTLSKITEPGLLREWLILGMGQPVYKMSLDHLLIPVGNEMLEKKIFFLILTGECQRDRAN